MRKLRLPSIHQKIKLSKKQTQTILFSSLTLTLFITIFIFSITKLPASNPFSNVLRNLTSRVITWNNIVRLESPRSNFTRGETPSFTLSSPIQSAQKLGLKAQNTWKTTQETIQATIRNKKNNISIPVEIKKTQEGKFQVTASDMERLKPGNYTLEISATESVIYTRNLTQDFTWGVLAINTNKSIYAPGEKAELSFGVVDHLGHTVCDSVIVTTITAPNGKKIELSTKEKTISRSTECKGDTHTLLPDYSATYQTDSVGKYQIDVTATTENGSHTIQDYFEVKESALFDVERTQFPSRMYPRASYDVKMTVVPRENYSGIVTDYVPKDFRIYSVSDNGQYTNQPLRVDDSRMYNSQLLEKSEQDTLTHLVKQNPLQASTSAALSVDKTSQPITWNVSWQKGQVYTLTYTIVFPLKSPEYYLLGPLKIGDFEEIRRWQIAGDAVKCWDGGGGDNNWTTNTNWDGDTVPATTDTATFGETGSCASVVGSPDKDVTINSGFTNPSGTGGGINIQSSYGGTMTQGSGVAITIGSGGFSQAAATFTGAASGDITIQTGGDFSLTGGAFTSTAGLLYAQDDWTISGGTFTPNGGTVQIDANADNAATVTGSQTFANLTFGETGTGDQTVTIANGTTVTVPSTGALTFAGNTSTSHNKTVNSASGSIVAQGNITAVNLGCKGTAVVTVNGTGDQTIAGAAASRGAIPAITINKSSGTLNFTNTITVTDNWTWTQGTMDFGSSTIVFNPSADTTQTIDGSTTFTFNNLQFFHADTSDMTITINSGATLTVPSTGTLSFVGHTSTSHNKKIVGTGSIVAQGNITTTDVGVSGSTIVTVNGTGDQSITGSATLNGRVPGLTVNKSSGNLTFINKVTFTDNFTLTAGTFVVTGATLGFSAVADTAMTVDIGTQTFENLTVENGLESNDDTITLASGTILTTGTLGMLGATNRDTTLNGPGTISVTGNISMTNDGVKGSSVITINGTGTQTFTGDNTSNDAHFPSVVINKSNNSTLSFSNTVNFSNDWTYTAATLDFGTSTIQFSGNQDGSATVTGSATFYNLTIGDSGSTATITINSGTVLTVPSARTLTFEGTTNSSTKTISGNSGSIIAQGNITVVNNGVSGSGNILLINGTGSQIITGDTGEAAGDTFAMPGVTINKTSGTLSFVNRVNVTGNWTYTQGTLDFGTSTVSFSGTPTITGSTTFNDVTFGGPEGHTRSDPMTLTIASGTNMIVAGAARFLSTGNSSDKTINGPGTLELRGNVSVTNTATTGVINGNVAISFTGTSNVTFSQSQTTFPGTVTINKASGSVTLTSAWTMNRTGQDFTIQSGTVDVAGFSLTVNDVFTIGSSGTLKLQGAETISTIDTYTSGSTVDYAGTGTYSSLILGTSYDNLTISGSGSYTLGSSTTVNGNFTQSAGTFSLSNLTLSVAKNFGRTGGTFTASTGTVRFITPSQTSVISGNTTFYNLLSIASGKAFQFTNGTTQTVSNNLTLTGTRNNVITLDSTTPGSQWDINVSGSANVSYVSVKDSDACSGNTITASISADRGNNTCWTFSGSTAVGWYDNAWTKRKVIIINHTKVADDLVNFPMLVSTSSDADMAANVQADADDILFTSDDGTTKLSHEIEKYTTATGELIAWVKIPALSASSDVNIYMYFGNAAATSQQDVTNVWDSNYAMVQHLGETTSCPQTFTDSTSNNNDGSCNDGSPVATTGKIGGAQDIGAGHVYIPTSASLGATSAITIQGWINADTQGTGPFLYYDDPGSTNLGPFMWRFSTYQNFYWQTVFTDATGNDVESAALMNTGTWHYVTGTYDGTTVRAYVDGQPSGTPESVSKTLRTSGFDFYLGGYAGHATPSIRYFDGSMDEVKISNTARSAEWILTEYNNQSDPSTFFSVSPSTIEAPRVQVQGGVRIQQGTRIYTQ